MGVPAIATAPMDMKKFIKILIPSLLVIFCLLQLTNPSRTNPSAKADFLDALHPPPEVATALTQACYDCHSYQTRWPWYSHVAPVSWLIASDVFDGRSHLNFSDWPTNDLKHMVRHMEEMSDQISSHTMPPSQYTLIHAQARLTDAQRKTMTEWLDSQSDALVKSTP